MALYNRILRTYYQSFGKEFVIMGFVEEKGDIKKTPFYPADSLFYEAFFNKKNLIKFGIWG
jgi:hypothetical protein